MQNVLHNFEIVHVQFANFWPKPDPNSSPNPNPHPKANPNLTLILTLAKSCSTFCKLCRVTHCAQHYYHLP